MRKTRIGKQIFVQEYQQVPSGSVPTVDTAFIILSTSPMFICTMMVHETPL